MLTPAIIKRELRLIQEQRFISLRVIAEELGINYSTLMRIIHSNAERCGSWQTLEKINRYISEMKKSAHS